MEDTMFRADLLKAKRILVTGGGSGLGEVMAEGYSRLGATVYICGRRGEVLENTAKRISEATGEKVVPIVCDIRDAEAIDAMIAKIWEDGPLTGLVNNAAGNFISRTQDLSSRGFNAVSDIVFRGTFYVTNACGKRWIDGGDKGSVISILASWVWTGGAYAVPSAMSKAALHIMTKSLAVEWGRYGIRLNGLSPGPFPTKGAWSRLHPGAAKRDDPALANPMRRVGEMSELVNLAVFLMADGCEFLTGQTIAIDGGTHLVTGTTAKLLDLEAEDWAAIRNQVKSVNKQDKELRTL